jgi:hypothetical protein
MMHKQKIEIAKQQVVAVNRYLKHPKNKALNDFWRVVKKYGTVEKINKKAERAGSLEYQLDRMKRTRSPWLKEINWLTRQQSEKNFITKRQYQKKVLGGKYSRVKLKTKLPVVLEISSYQYFPWLVAEAKKAIKQGDLMPARFIRVRSPKEQRQTGELLAVTAAMNVIGATYVESLDTKGTDGSNIHLNGPETITGYFGGIGQPNSHALKWLDEYLYYYTNYGVREVLNFNWGTVLLAYFLRQIGIKNEIKISVFLGNDNPYSIMMTLLLTKLFLAKDDTTALTGFNIANSVDDDTILQAAQIRKELGLEQAVRFEHHITEAYRSIVRQPYNRRAQLLRVAGRVKNISAKHEGGEIKVEQKRVHASDILDYFIPLSEVKKQGLMKKMEQNYLDKHHSLNLTAKALTKHGLDVAAANNLH